MIGSKINTLLVRTTPRDLYDTYCLYKNGNIKNETLIRKIAIFYVCLGSEMPIDFDRILSNAMSKINNLTFGRIRETLIPVLHKGIVFDLNEMRDCVSGFLSQFFKLDENDRTFIKEFNEKRFKPEILFSGLNIEDVKNHPMALWKTK